MTDENLFDQHLDPHIEIPKIIAMLALKDGPVTTKSETVAGNAIDKLREKLALSEKRAVCMWCGSTMEGLPCLRNHVFIDASLLHLEAIREACVKPTR